MKVHLNLIALTLFFLSCQNRQNQEKAAQHTYTRVTSDSIISDNKGNELNTGSFDTFWKTFRQAILALDTTQIMASTKFPFETRGPLDSDPIIIYSKQKFLDVLEAYLNQWNGIDLEGTTEFESIKKTILVKKDDIENDYARVGNLEFNKTKDGWKLVFAYLNYETIDSLDK